MSFDNLNAGFVSAPQGATKNGCVTLRHHALGERIAGCIHSVITNLPTMADVIGYEEQSPAVTDKVRSGYPRFIRHPFVGEAARKFAEKSGLGTRALFPLATREDALRVVALAGQENDFGIIEADGWVLLHLSPNDPEIARRAGKIIQHTGVSVSSRQAEDWLVSNKFLRAAEPENLFTGDSPEAVKQALLPLLAPATAGDIFLSRAGMSAFFAAFEATRKVQRTRGRTLWLQLGWAYTDTTAILKKFLFGEETFALLPDVADAAGIEDFFETNGARIAGIVAEMPTNPLVQTGDVARLATLARKHGAICIFDPTIAGAANVDLLPHCDLLVSSLTKYAAHCGDVMAGVAVLNPRSPFYSELLPVIQKTISPPYSRDCARLAAQIGDLPAVSLKINYNTMRLAAFLEKHPAVRRVHWAYSPATAKNYSAIARAPESPGCMISFELTTPVARFFDRLACAKAASFGTDFTLVSPFIYLAHYDLASTREGRRQLLAAGIDPELIRVSIGTEPYAEIEAAFAEALG